MHFKAHTITVVTRRNITDFIAAEEVAWWGRLDEIAFLKRVWPDLDERPSTDPRFSSATRDVRQHRQYNLDWDNNWVFDDERLAGLA